MSVVNDKVVEKVVAGKTETTDFGIKAAEHKKLIFRFYGRNIGQTFV